jgi:SAM-dependent methyltransferase
MRCAELATHGDYDLLGADFSAEMIAAARRDVAGAQFQLVSGGPLPFAQARFDAVLLFAVLTCIASSAAQRALFAELHRVLRPGGLLLVSDYPLQTDARNVARYEAFAAARGDMGAESDLPYGVFRLPDGALVRHHTQDWFDSLFAAFRIEHQLAFDATTMNGNSARIAQWWLRA